jgi:hypothetical protein
MTAIRPPRWFAQELAAGKTADAAYVLAGYRENRSNAANRQFRGELLKFSRWARSAPQPVRY